MKVKLSEAKLLNLKWCFFLIVWIAFALFLLLRNYSVTSFDMSWVQSADIQTAIKNLGILLWYVGSAFGLGSFILQRFHQSALSGAAYLNLSFLLGLALLYVLWLCLGLLGVFSIQMISIFLTLFTILAIGPGIKTAKAMQQELLTFRIKLQNESLIWRLFMMGIFVLPFLLIPIYSLVNNLNGDALSYNLPISNTLAYLGKLRLLPILDPNVQTFGFVGEMHFAALLVLKGMVPIFLLTSLIFISSIYMLVMIGESLQLGLRGLAITVVSALTTIPLYYMLGTGSIHIFGIALALAATYVLIALRDIRLCGLLAGFATVALQSNLIAFVPVLSLIFLWQEYMSLHSNRESTPAFIKPLVRQGIIFGIWFLLPMISHWFKNWIIVGHPFAVNRIAEHVFWWKDFAYTPLTAITNIVMHPIEVIFGESPINGGMLSYLVLLFMPLGILLVRREKTIFDPKKLAIAAIVGILCWIICFPSLLVTRYVIATLLLFIPFAAKGAELFSLKNKVLSGLILLLCLHPLIHYQVFADYNIKLISYLRSSIFNLSWQVVSETNTICDKGKGTYCNEMQILNTTANPNERVLSPIFYLGWMRPDLLVHASSYNEYNQVFQSKSPQVFWQLIRKGGFRYIYLDNVHGAGLFWDPPMMDFKQLPSDMSVTTIKQTDSMKLYQVSYIQKITTTNHEAE